jgi:hypothetical protein
MSASRDRRQRDLRLAMALVVGLMALVLSACSEGKPGHNAYLHRTYGDGLSVNIANVDNEAEGRPYAERYCRRLGRAALFKRMESLNVHRETAISALFDCTAPKP